MQRKILNTKKVRSGFYTQSGQEKLHSIPILNKYKYMKKSSVLYSIPCVAALLLVAIINLVIRNKCLAASAEELGDYAPDYTTITPINSSTTPPTTVSLSLSKTNLTSSATTPGNTATASTNVTVNVSNAKSYNLILKVDKTNLTNGSTTITAGNATTNNTWGYKWDTASSYAAPSTTGANLTNLPALDSNGDTSFTKTLTFAAKFGTNATAGHYNASGTLSLVATPKAAAITLADLTQMQQLTLAPDACANTPYLDGKNYSAEYALTDVRDGIKYTVHRLDDGKCWMTSNLKLSTCTGGTCGSYYTKGRILNSTTSDLTSGTFTLPASNSSGFSDDTAVNVYLNGVAFGGNLSENSTGYYTWCAATAGCKTTTGTNPDVGQNAASSICPKGWKLPTGDRNSKTTDFWQLFRDMGLTISNDSLDQTGANTSWGAGDLAIVQGAPYYFTPTGRYANSSLGGASYQGYWWSRTSANLTSAYYLYVSNTNMSPTAGSSRYAGMPVRCVAQ